MLKTSNAFHKKFAKWVAVLGFLGIVCYPVIIGPMIDSSKYKEIQKNSRKGIIQEDIQPGNMRVWRDPFERK